VFAIALVVPIFLLVRKPGLHPALLLVVVLVLIMAIFKLCRDPLKVKDCVIRPEERLRLATLLGAPWRPDYRRV